jgi:hypothetical protein
LYRLQSRILSEERCGKSKSTAWLTFHSGDHHGLVDRLQVASLLLLVLLHELTVPFLCFFIQEGLDADSASFGSKMATQSISTGESTATSPLTTATKIPATHELLLSRV